MTTNPPSRPTDWGPTTPKGANDLFGGIWDWAARVDNTLSHSGTSGHGLIFRAASLSSIPAGETVGQLIGYRNSGDATISIAGQSLAPGEWGVWAWYGTSWGLLNASGSAPGGGTTPTPDVITETFQHVDGTVLAGRTTTTGGLTWANDTSGISGTGGASPGVALGARFAKPDDDARGSALTLSRNTVEISLDYDVSGATNGDRVRLGLGGANKITCFVAGGSDGVKLYQWAGATPSQIGGTIFTRPLTGRITLGYDGTNAYVKIGSDVVVSGPVTVGTPGTQAAIGLESGTGRPSADNMLVTLL